MTWVWSTVTAGLQRWVLWHASQVLLVGMCDADLPVAVVPLWQLIQVPVATLAWLNEALAQVDVVWQSSQVLALAMWSAGLPVAVAPLWQLKHVPSTSL